MKCSSLTRPLVLGIWASAQENMEGSKTMCATVVLDADASDLSNRIGNEVYHACRSGALRLPNFPEFEAVISALKNVSNQHVPRPYKVCTHTGSGLAVLQVYAQKWLDDENTRDKANALIEDHNQKFNANGEFVQADTPARTCSLEVQLFHPNAEFLNGLPEAKLITISWFKNHITPQYRFTWPPGQMKHRSHLPKNSRSRRATNAPSRLSQAW